VGGGRAKFVGGHGKREGMGRRLVVLDLDECMVCTRTVDAISGDDMEMRMRTFLVQVWMGIGWLPATCAVTVRPKMARVVAEIVDSDACDVAFWSAGHPPYVDVVVGRVIVPEINRKMRCGREWRPTFTWTNRDLRADGRGNGIKDLTTVMRAFRPRYARNADIMLVDDNLGHTVPNRQNGFVCLDVAPFVVPATQHSEDAAASLVEHAFFPPGTFSAMLRNAPFVAAHKKRQWSITQTIPCTMLQPQSGMALVPCSDGQPVRCT